MNWTIEEWKSAVVRRGAYANEREAGGDDQNKDIRPDKRRLYKYILLTQDPCSPF